MKIVASSRDAVSEDTSRMVLNRSLCWSLLLLLLATRASSFATPKSEFLLQVDGNSVDLSTSHICVLEQKQGTSIGGRARCWGEDFHDFGHVDNIPTDVSETSTAADGSRFHFLYFNYTPIWLYKRLLLCKYQLRIPPRVAWLWTKPCTAGGAS